MARLTRRFLTNRLTNLNLSFPIRYERYYINSNLRIQKKDNKLEKEILDNNNNIIQKLEISSHEFQNLKEKAYSKIIRDSYLYKDDSRISIKKYQDLYEGLIRVEVTFSSLDEMNQYKKE